MLLAILAFFSKMVQWKQYPGVCFLLRVSCCDVCGRKGECLVVTGPNMGGKSSTVRMAALICIMGQVRRALKSVGFLLL